MTKVTDKSILQLGLKASAGDEAAIQELYDHIGRTYSVNAQTTETTTEPEPKPPQEAV